MSDVCNGLRIENMSGASIGPVEPAQPTTAACIKSQAMGFQKENIRRMLKSIMLIVHHNHSPLVTPVVK